MGEVKRPKFAVVGKGGVGKTTVSAGLTLALLQKGVPVFAIDGDSNSSLGYALGFPKEQLAAQKPLAEMREELEERAKPGGSDLYLLTPPVDDLIEDFSLTRDNLRLLVMGTIGEAGSGCACGLNTALREVLRQLAKREEALVVDMEAGIEHMGRGTASALDMMIIVAEPAESSLRTAQRVVELAKQMGVKHLAVVANKVRTDPTGSYLPEDMALVHEALDPLPVIQAVPYMRELREPLTERTEQTDLLLALMRVALDQLPS